MLKNITSFFSALVLSVFSLFALYTPSVSAATLTWTGGGSDLNFSTADNWDPQQAPENGDSLTFDRDSFDFGDWDSQVIPINDIENLEILALQIQGDSNSNMIEIQGEPLMITEAINDSSPSTSLRIDSLVLAGNVSYDHSGSAPAFTSGSSMRTQELDLNGYQLTANNWINVDSSLIGAGDFIMNGGRLTLEDVSNYDGGLVTLNNTSSIAVNADGAGSTDQISINGSNESSVIFCGGAELEFAGDVTIGGDGPNGSGAMRISEFCFGSMGGGGATDGPPEMTLTLSGLVELTADTKVRVAQNQTMYIESIETNGFSIDLTEDSSGLLNVEGDEFVSEPRTIVIEEGDDDSLTSLTVLVHDTVVLNGSRGYVNVFGTLKGVGSAERIVINGGAALAPGLSPGCMQTNQLDFASTGTYEVEIGGTVACDEYDQMQVSDTTSLGDTALDVTLIDGFTPSIGDEFVIILSEGSATVSGIFDDLEEGAEFTVGDVTFSITYEGGEGENDVVLMVVDAPEADAPDAPDTGFALITASPLMSFLVAIVSAGGLAIFARRHLQTS